MNLRIALFYHSLVSDWNHGNAHFLRGIATELLSLGHSVTIFEPHDGWSRANLLSQHGEQAVTAFHKTFPHLQSRLHRADDLHLDNWLDRVDLALIHEWNSPALISAIGHYRRRHPHLRVLFHDTHHRAYTARDELSRFDLENYDGVLAYGASLKDAYERLGWGRRVYVWHEAADTSVFYPRNYDGDKRDVVWIGNWGDEERTQELRDYLVSPVRRLGLKAQVHGVRYPQSALAELKDAGIHYAGWLPNYIVPEVFSQFKATLHVPRRPYVEQLPGIPTIRPFEALACGIPLVSAPWRDSEGLFRQGVDLLMASDATQMQQYLSDVMNNQQLRIDLARHGLETIRGRHTCGHRVRELLNIYRTLMPGELSSEPASDTLSQVEGVVRL